MANMPSQARMARVAVVLLSAALLGGCGTIRGWFDRDEDANAPAELAEISPTLQVQPIWSASAGKGEGRTGARQGPAIADGRVYAAALEGGVRAFDLQTGAVAWHAPSEFRLSGGPGVGDGLVVVGGLDGEVVALDAATGAQRWTAEVPNEVIAAPAIGQGVVLVRSNDGRVTAFDAATGERRWFWTSDLPLLTVRGYGEVVLAPNLAFVGTDGGELVALALQDGRELWRLPVAQQEGRTELDRMADIDGGVLLDATTLYASSYKGRTLAVDGPTGQPLWASEQGGAGRVGNGPNVVVVSDAKGTVWALDKATGSAMWQQDALARRDLSGVAVQGEHAVVGDFDGYLHWISLADGSIAARDRVGNDAIRSAPRVADGVLVVQDIEGRLRAYRVGG
jgi:outer membrane protein assembly factor BamB